MAQRALCACVGQGAADVFFSDRHGIGSRLASLAFRLLPCFCVYPTGDGPRCWIATFPLVLYYRYLGTFVSRYLPYLWYHDPIVCLTRNLWTYRFVSLIRNSVGHVPAIVVIIRRLRVRDCNLSSTCFVPDSAALRRLVGRASYRVRSPCDSSVLPTLPACVP